MKMGPSLAVGEAERGGDWGHRVGGTSSMGSIHRGGQSDGSMSSGHKGGPCFGSDEGETDEDCDDSLRELPSSHSSLTQRLLCLRHKHMNLLNMNSSSTKKVKCAPQSPRPNQSRHFTNIAAINNSNINSSDLSSSASYSSPSPESEIHPGCSSGLSSHKHRTGDLSSSSSGFSSGHNDQDGHHCPTPSRNSEVNDSRGDSTQHRYHRIGRSLSPKDHSPSSPLYSPQNSANNSPDQSPRRFFGGSRPISSLARPLVALAVPGMFLVCKYHQYRRAHQEASRRRAAERELHHLNHKIDKLLDKLDEHEPEPALCREEECVICVNAKATMQTFPCAHRVVCRKCFVKTIQVAVSQRLLPLRCVVCRAKILRLRQSNAGMPTSISQYGERGEGLSSSQSCQSFVSASSGASGASGTSSSTLGSASTPGLWLHGRRQHGQGKKVPIKSSAHYKEVADASPRSPQESPSSLPLLSSPSPCIHITAHSHQTIAPQAQVLPFRVLRRQNTAPEPHGVVAGIAPLGPRSIRVHIRENKVAPQEGVGRLPTIREYAELHPEKNGDKERHTATRIRGAQRLISQLELANCSPRSPSPYSTSSTASSFLSLTSPSSPSLSASSSSLSSFKSSFASPHSTSAEETASSPLSTNRSLSSLHDFSSPRIPSPTVRLILPPGKDDVSPGSSTQHSNLNRYSVLSEGSSSPVSDAALDFNSVADLRSDDDETDSEAWHDVFVESCVCDGSVQYDKNKTSYVYHLYCSRSGSNNRAVSSSRNSICGDSIDIKNGQKTGMNIQATNKIRPVNDLSSIKLETTKIGESESKSKSNCPSKCSSDAKRSQPISTKKFKTKSSKNCSNGTINNRCNIPPQIYNYRENPKYFFYTYTGDSSKEIPLAKLANSKSNTSLKSATKNSAGKAIIKSSSTKSLSSKTTTKAKSSCNLPKSSSSSSRLSGNKRPSSSSSCKTGGGEEGDRSLIKSSSSNKSISSTASTSSGGSCRSIHSSTSNNSASSFKSAMSSHSCRVELQGNSTNVTVASSSTYSLSKSSKNSYSNNSFVCTKSNTFPNRCDIISQASTAVSKSRYLNICTPPSVRHDSFFSKSPSPTYNSLDSNSSSSKCDAVSSSKSSREGSLNRDLDVSSCSSSSASTATIRSYRSLLPVGLLGGEAGIIVKEQRAYKDKQAKKASSDGLIKDYPFQLESAVTDKGKNLKIEKAGVRGLSMGKDMLEKAIKGGRSKSAKLSKGIKGVRWKDDDEKEDNNNTPAKKAKPEGECRKSEGILRSKMFTARHYYRLK